MSEKTPLTIDQDGNEIDETAEQLNNLGVVRARLEAERQRIADERIIFEAMKAGLDGASNEEIAQQFPDLPISIEELRARQVAFNQRIIDLFR